MITALVLATILAPIAEPQKYWWMAPHEREAMIQEQQEEEPQVEYVPAVPAPTASGGDAMTYAGCYELTAYIATGNPCASGVYPTVGRTVACNSIPLGTTVYIEGYGTYVVEDTGGMGGGVIDVFVGSYDEAIQFGRRSAEVYIVD